MKRAVRHIAGFVATFSLTAAVHAGVLLTDVVGAVRLGEGGAPAGVLSSVDDGKELSLGEGARAVAVDLASGREYLLRGPGRFAIEAAGPRALKGAAPEVRTVAAGSLPSAKVASGRVAQATFVMRSIRPLAVPLPLSPVRTVVVATPPTLRWTAVDGASGYRVSIVDEAGQQVFERQASGAEMALPGDLVRPGTRYHWRVEAQGASGRLSDASASFSVAPQATLASLAAAHKAAGNDFGRRVLYGLQLQEAGASEEARALWKALAAERPDDEQLRRMGE